MGKLDDTCLLRASCAVSFKPSEETTWRTYPLKIGLRYPHNPSPEKKKPLANCYHDTVDQSVQARNMALRPTGHCT